MPRPKKPQLISELLKYHGEGVTKDRDGKRRERKELLVRYLWDAILEATIRLPNHVNIELGPRDWIDFVKFTLNYMEPAESRVKISGADGVMLAQNVAAMSDDQLMNIIEKANRIKSKISEVDKLLADEEPVN